MFLSDTTVYSLIRYIDVGDIFCTPDRVFVSSDGLFDYMVYYSEYSAMTVYSLIQCIEWGDYVVPRIVRLSDMTVYSRIQCIG